MRGIVINFNTERGIGTILGDDGIRYFVHFSNIKKRDYKVLFPKEYVRFEIQKVIDPQKNDVAVNIVPKKLKGHDKSLIQKNPFNLGPINKPEEFAGRKHLIEEGVSALINNNNILLIGGRGMGKSSLANQFFYIAQGNNYLIEKLNIELKGQKKLDYGVVAIRAFKNSTINDIAANIVRELIKKYQLDKNEEIQREINLKVYKLKMETFTSEMSMENLIDFFNYDIIKIYDYLKFKNGLLILIDEVENIDPETGFANFIKNVTEYFSTEGKNINFILSGIPSTITNLFFQHPSFLRLFTPLEVKELSVIEAYELTDGYIRKSTKLMEKNAKTFIGQISRGYPVSLQLLGFYSFQLDTDNLITVDDINNAATHIVVKVKEKEFDNKHESIGYGLSENILKLAVTEWKGKVTQENLKELFKNEKEDRVTKAIRSLEDAEILYKVRKGLYFIRDHFFYLYLKNYYKNLYKT
jgi:cold shock CspA family protein